MIQSYRNEPFSLASTSSPISLTTDCIRSRNANCCGWLQHSEGSPLYKILQGGNYEVEFTANVSGLTAGPVAIGILVDGIPLETGASAITTVTTPGDYENISIHKVIPICCRGDATITIASLPSVLTGATLPGTATDTVIPLIQNANLVIIRKS